MWHFRLFTLQDAAVFVSISLYMCHLVRALSVLSPQRSLSGSVMEDVFFSVAVNFSGTPTVSWTFLSARGIRPIGTWQPGMFSNITAEYRSRVQNYDNGSLLLTGLRPPDAGLYLVTVTDPNGDSRELGFILTVNELLYEDLQYLSVSAFTLAVAAALLMLGVWLLHEACRRIKAWRRRKQMPENDATELQPL
ncbi:V-set and transmembrane domain-containing protein 5 [Menidia menidia]